MDKKNYKLVVYFIATTIILTISAQVYWNVREYHINKQHLVSKVQRSLDNSIENYFANLTKSGFITFTSLDNNSNPKIDTVYLQSTKNSIRKLIDSTLQGIAQKESEKPILIKNNRNSTYPFFTKNKNFPESIDSLISKVFISISRDTIDLQKLDGYLQDEFSRINVHVDYALTYEYRERIDDENYTTNKLVLNEENITDKGLKVESKSTFLPHRSKLELVFTNETAQVLKRSLLSIFFSLLLSISIIFSLYYLLKTIYKQKQLAEVKNDLISNITHEFKTPIATISTALEALKNFNALSDKVKSEKYISIANKQVDKLALMVEKILDTASLNNEDLVLDKKEVDIVELVQNVLEKYKLIDTHKTFNFSVSCKSSIFSLDEFHFENAVGNIIDNAVKYGGDIISVTLKETKNGCVLSFTDNGIGIPKSQKDKVFEQFYRIPTGNTHNVKGFGIGLFYTKSIIEKHHGKISIEYNNQNQTVFKIEMFYD